MTGLKDQIVSSFAFEKIFLSGFKTSQALAYGSDQRLCLNKPTTYKNKAFGFSIDSNKFVKATGPAGAETLFEGGPPLSW